MKQTLIAASVAMIGSGAAFTATAQTAPNRFELVETTVPQIRQALQSRLMSSEELVQMYLARIAAYDDAGPLLNSYLTVNPRAAAEA